MASGLTGILGKEPVSRDQATVRRRLVDSLDPRLVNLLTALGFGLPVVLYFWLLHLYSVNVIVSDQLSDLTVIAHSYTHLFDWGPLWAQHNENRILFPNMVVVLLAHTTQFNVQIEEYLGASMLVAAVALLIWAHKRRSPAIPWLYYCPVALLAFSVVQYQNTLWGFQMAWYLVLLALATSVVLIDRLALTWLSLIGAVVAAVIGSFSSLQGLLIWPAGLLLIYHRRRATPFAVTWIIAASFTAVIYFYNFNTSTGSPRHGWDLQHPVAAAKFYVFAVGDILGIPQQYDGPGNNFVLLLGLIILALALLILVAFGIRRDEHGGSAIGVALICVGLIFVGTVAAGRGFFGYYGASQSRYTTYDLLIPIGILLALLGRPTLRKDLVGSRAQPEGGLREESPRQRFGDGIFAWVDRVAAHMACWVIAIIVVLQVVFGFHYGIEGARTTYAYDVRAAHVLRNIDRSSNEEVALSLDIFSSVPFIRHQARIAQLHHLSVFANSSDP